MQFRDLKQQYQVLKKDIDEAMIKVATDCNFIIGAQVSELEKELAEYVGVKHCITCANGTDALSIAMMAWGIGSGDAVFVPDFTFFSSGEIVSHCGATPVFVDVDQDTYNLSVESLEIAIEKVIKEDKLTPKAIVAVDLSDCRLTLQKYALLLKNMAFWCLKTVLRVLGAALEIRLRAALEIFPLHRFSRLNRWDATGTAERCSPITTSGQT